MRRLTQGERQAMENVLRASVTIAEMDRIRAQAAAAERARIVAWLREEADAGPVGAGAACRYAADLIEGEARAP